jgi:hypothetical protein
VVGVIYNLFNKDNSPTTSAHDDSSINEPTPNIFLSSSLKLPNPITNPTTSIAHAWTIGFHTSNTIIKKRITKLASYSTTRRIQAPCPT